MFQQLLSGMSNFGNSMRNKVYDKSYTGGGFGLLSDSHDRLSKDGWFSQLEKEYDKNYANQLKEESRKATQAFGRQQMGNGLNYAQAKDMSGMFANAPALDTSRGGMYANGRSSGNLSAIAQRILQGGF